MPSSKPFSVCYFHIGTEKTGTTSIQACLAANRAKLLTRGILFPAIFGPKANHFMLAVYGQNDDKVDDLRRTIGVTTPAAIRQQRLNLEEGFSAEVGKASGARTLLLSNEHCHSRLITREEIQRVHDLLSPYCERFQVIVYLRPQHELALSRYSTHIKLGGLPGSPFPVVDRFAPYYNYNQLLMRWGKVFGDDSLKPRIFSRSELVGGDVLADFLAQVGVDPAGLDTVPTQNESLSPEALEFLGRLNRYLPLFVDQKPAGVRGNIAQVVERLFPGKGPRPPRAEVERFYRIFEESNQKVAEKFFPNRGGLFEPDFSVYGDDESGSALTMDQAFRMFAEVWKAKKS